MTENCSSLINPARVHWENVEINTGGVESRKYGTAVFKVVKLVPVLSLNLKKSLLSNNLFFFFLNSILIASQKFKIVVFFPYASITIGGN